MRNPFTLLKGLFIKEEERQAIVRRRKKDEGTKKETGRSKSGGGSTSITADKVTQERERTYFDSAQRKAIKRRRTRNKIARRSRRINRLKAA